ncbi:FMN-dependent oxidoreductase, nitrilotriacetate monooxygenase family [Rathayibacter oskolensis]|uniref:FMN-dependent oxidoreductase, nitrilotriacetate monooxygenase family n=1 Tax=Rathayibacter oskolensis TaxID=1891671 RepID=A0A1X7PFL2_9MICO|nr:NtaA/DmoA family FMN-dependent monooxygenase [Rathayibacter oskolensis]SMH49501.1 FMN-dependent oxidoreductase, nitrilotriacetate monooxygenase family [Rathayibacter oskolensis]
MKKMHLSVNLSEYGRHSGAWRHPESDLTRIPNTAVYVHTVQTAERGLFDQAFIADTPVHSWGRSSSTSTRLDPLELASALAACTSRIAIIATLSTSYNEPYDVARRAASTASIMGGRLGINYVASSGDATARNFGRSAQLPHDERYERSNEFIEVVTKLWAAAATPELPAERVRHHGKHFDVDAALDIAQPPAGRPVIVQAGSSSEGRDLAARWADAIYAGGSTLERAKEYYDDIKRRAAAYGRDPDTVKVLLGIAPFLGETEEEARALQTALDDNHAEGADVIAHLSGLLEHDLTAYDPDGPLPFDLLPTVTTASISQATLFTRMAREEGLTIAEVAYRSYVGGLANMQFVSTGTPVQVADTMEEWFLAGACDGYSLVAPILPRTIDDFVDLVVPILQERGLFRTAYEGSTILSHFGLDAVHPHAVDPRAELAHERVA